MQVKDLAADLRFVSDSQDVQEIKRVLGDEASDFDSFFVAVENGMYASAYGMEGIIPYIHKQVTKIV